MEDAFNKYAHNFLKRCNIVIEDKDDKSINDFESLLKRLENCDLDSSDIRCHLEYFWLDKEKPKAIYRCENIYEMGNRHTLTDSECLLAKEIVKKNTIPPNEANLDNDNEYDTSDIKSQILNIDSDLIDAIKRPNYYVAEGKKSTFRFLGLGWNAPGLIGRLNAWLKFDITLFLEKRYRGEICKIIYFVWELENEVIPQLLGGKRMKFNVLKFLSNQSMESISASYFHRDIDKSKITCLIKKMLEKEMSLKSDNDINCINDTLSHVANTWDGLLYSIRMSMDVDEDAEIKEKFRALKYVLLELHGVPTYNEVKKLASGLKNTIETLDSAQGTLALESILDKLDKHKKGEEANPYTFGNFEGKQIFQLDEAIRELKSLCKKQYKIKHYNWNGEMRCYEFIAPKKKRILVYESLISDSAFNLYQASPIVALYLKISQYERLGEINDLEWINEIQIKSNYEVPSKFLKRLKPLRNKMVDIDGIVKYIDENVATIAEFVYMKMNSSQKEQKRILESKWKVLLVVEYYICARLRNDMKKGISELLIISCLQAILIDQKSDDEYTFYAYQDYMKHKAKIRLKEDKYIPAAIKLCWVRKTEDHWYANIGRHKYRELYRDFENRIYEILREIYNCPSVLDMSSLSQYHYGKLSQFNCLAQNFLNRDAIQVKCPICDGTNVIKHGRSESGKQRYYCKNSNCSGKSFQLEHNYTGCKPGIDDEIITMAANASGIRSTSRVLGISQYKVMSTLKKQADA